MFIAMTKTKLFLILVFVSAFLLRFYRVGDYPPLLWDEASLAYNAYSILKTGKDEYGQFFPLVFRSFGDFKPGFYVYLALPFVYLFGLNQLAVRLPSVLAGSFLPVIIFLWMQKYYSRSTFPYIISLITCFNPFNLHFSRGAWESNILVFELVLAVYLFSQSRHFLSSVIFALTFYTYHSAKLLTPLILLALLSISQRPKFCSFYTPLIILIFPIIFGLVIKSNTNRLAVTSLFSYPRSPEETMMIINESSQFNFRFFHHQIIYFSRNFFDRYFNHFSPRFLIFEGDWQNPRHSAPYVGVLLFPSILFLIIGLLISDYRLPITKFLFLWLLLSPIPAALTRDSLSAVRALPLSIPLLYFISLGLLHFLKKFSSLFVCCLLVTVYILSFFYYSDLYHNHLLKKSPLDNLYGYRQTIKYLLANQTKYRSIYLTNFYGQPYIYYLFYGAYPPGDYQPQANLIASSVDVGWVKSIDQIHFWAPEFSSIRLQPSTLVIYSHDELIRQNIDPKILTPLSSINQISTFYAYQNP